MVSNPLLGLPPHLRHESPNGASTPNSLGKFRAASLAADSTVGDTQGHSADDFAIELDPRAEAFREQYQHSERALQRLLFGIESKDETDATAKAPLEPATSLEATSERPPSPVRPARRVIDEDDYGDEEEEQEEPVREKETLSVQPRRPTISTKPSEAKATPIDDAESSEQARKKLEEDRKTAEDAAKRSFHSMFYTLEHDRDAMLEQQRLEEMDRQVEAEMSGRNPGVTALNAQQGKLSNVNLGASSLTLKHLIARIDEQRPKVRLTDTELKNLLSEVKKNRSKWASEDKVGQEELYEAAEKVLSELKAMTEHSSAFLGRVNKREAPDYYQIIKYPMDLGTMTKKLKSLSYRSKNEFVSDVQAIWSNCLRYNAEPTHFLRKHALAMRKETEKLIPLIPDIVIRDRAEVEAEERRRQAEEAGDADGGEDSDDEPVLAGRGRKAPGKGAKKGASKPRTAESEGQEGTPVAEARPSIIVKSDSVRADSHPPFDGSQTGLATPPPGATGSLTPLVNGVHGSQADLDAENLGSSLSGLMSREDAEYEDLEYKTWKSVTKKDRAQAAASRNRLFSGYQISPDEPALLRSKSGMRTWMKHQQAADDDATANGSAEPEADRVNESLAEGMEDDMEKMLPDYYDPLCAIPELPERLRWLEDNDGNVVNSFHTELKLAPRGSFVAAKSQLVDRINGNISLLQSTRKQCHRIAVVKQMQVQTQFYSGQQTKYRDIPFVEEDVAPYVVSDDSPVLAETLCRATLKRTVGKLFYHAGFEEFQPQAIEAITDIAADFFQKLTRAVKMYHEAPKLREDDGKLTSRYTQEEVLLLALQEAGMELDGLETYVRDDVERLGNKLQTISERYKAYYMDLLRPAVQDGGDDGSKSFDDGNEQFVAGDFAAEINEDYLGLRELGLDREFNIDMSFIPLHLLQSRVHNAYQANNQVAAVVTTDIVPQPVAFPPLTISVLKSQIGLVQNFFLAKLHANNDEPLIEDDDLPQKQRFPKPRLPPTGKITSPRKRPPKEQGGSAKKKKKTGPAPVGLNGTNIASLTPAKEVDEREANRPGKIRILPPGSAVAMERNDSKLSSSDGDAMFEKPAGGLMSPESMGA